MILMMIPVGISIAMHTSSFNHYYLINFSAISLWTSDIAYYDQSTKFAFFSANHCYEMLIDQQQLFNGTL